MAARSEIVLKTKEELALIKESAQILGKAHGVLSEKIAPGVTTAELDKLAYEFIKDHNGAPSFLGFNNFPATLCISVNEVVVHGFPGKYVLQEGDIISVDCGVLYKGFHSDSAYTYPVGSVKPEVTALLKATHDSLFEGIKMAKAGNRMGDIGFEIQQYVESRGYTVVRELVGHGIGKSLHEAPEVPNYGKRGKGILLLAGMVLAIEPMINLGLKAVVQEKDGWTIRTRDRQPSAHFEHTVAVGADGPEILTTYEYINPKYRF